MRTTAARWLERAADVAYRRGAVRESASVLERAVELEPDPLRRARLLRALAHSYAVLYEGEAFQAALEGCADASGDLGTRGEVMAELAYQSWLRPTLWQQQPDRAQIDRWIAEAMELNRQPTEARVKALTAMTFAHASSDRVTDGQGTATEATRIAELLDRDDLRFLACLGQLEISLNSVQTVDAMHWAGRLRALADSTDDPDERGCIEWYTAFAHAACGRIEDARALARDHDRIVSALTPHHVIHGLGVLTMIDELAGRWDCIRAVGGRLENAVAANAGTRCHLDARALLDCALAAHLSGDVAEATRFEALADEAMMPGISGLTVEVPRLRLAIARRDTATIERLLCVPTNLTYTVLATTSARLDGLAALDRGAEVEALAPALLLPGTYLEPFALRALGVVRRRRRPHGTRPGRIRCHGLVVARGRDCQGRSRPVTGAAAHGAEPGSSTALPVLRTARLAIRPLTNADGAACRAVLPALDDAAFRRWFTWAVAAPAALADLQQPPYGERAVVLATGELVGLVGLVPALGPFAQLEGASAGAPWTAELGLYWALSPAHRGRGYATEAATALCEALFAALTPKRLVALTEHGNGASQAVMRRLGMRMLTNPHSEPAWLQVVGILDRAPAQPA